MGKKRKQLSQAEIWDDSALLQSWDDALTEYKLYHSVHARGERIDDAIKGAEAEEQEAHTTDDDRRQAVAGMQPNGTSLVELEDGELEEEPVSVQVYTNGDSIKNDCGPSTTESEQKERLANASTAMNQQDKPGMPDAIINSVKDEALKNLMMSWYFAGYYTGLYEGQRQVQSSPPK